MSFVAAAVIGSSVIGAGVAISSSNKAAKAQQQATTASTALEQQQIAEARRQYDLSRGDLAPYREAGYTALGQLATGTANGGEFNRPYTVADFQADPGYEFRRTEGQRGVEASAAARGGLLSGGTLKALDRYNQGFASNEYQNAYSRNQSNLTDRYNRLAGIAGVGQQAVNSGNAAGQNYIANTGASTNSITNNIQNAANARASGYVAAGNAVGNAAGNIGNYFALKSLLKDGATNFNGIY